MTTISLENAKQLLANHAANIFVNHLNEVATNLGTEVPFDFSFIGYVPVEKKNRNGDTYKVVGFLFNINGTETLLEAWNLAYTQDGVNCPITFSEWATSVEKTEQLFTLFEGNKDFNGMLKYIESPSGRKVMRLSWNVKQPTTKQTTRKRNS